MIVRKEQNGQMILIGQTDHSRLVGQIAAHWGNARFATPKPYDSVVRAATFHDFGWLRYETSPITLEDGETPEFRKLPFDPANLEAYQWCNDWMSDIDAYSGLIVSLHRTGLWRRRYDTINHPTNSARVNHPAIETFVERNEAQQAKVRTAYDQDELWTNYWLLQVWDLLGLYFCCEEPCEDHIDPVPLTYGAAKSDGIRMTLKPLGPRKVQFDPYPFVEKGFRLQLGSKRLPKIKYADQDEFRRAYFRAPTEMIEFEIV